MTAGRSPQPSLRAATSASPLHPLLAKGHFGQAVGCWRPGASSRATCDSTRGHSLSRPRQAPRPQRPAPPAPSARPQNGPARADSTFTQIPRLAEPRACPVATHRPPERCPPCCPWTGGLGLREDCHPCRIQPSDASMPLAAWAQAVASFAGIFGLFLCWSSLITSTNCSRSSQASCVLFRRSAFFAVAAREKYALSRISKNADSRSARRGCATHRSIDRRAHCESGAECLTT